MDVLYKEQLDEIVGRGCDAEGCQNPHHNTLWLKAVCHVQGDVDALYHKDTGTLEIRCATCQKPVIAVRVKSLSDVVKDAKGAAG